MSRFVTTTPLHAMRPLGSPAERSLPRLEAILHREFKGGLSLALAEPVERKDGAGIDWYTDIDDAVTQLVAMPEPLADYYRSRLQADKAIVSTVIQQYEQHPDPAARTTATALRNAISYPGDEHIWLVGETQSGQARILLTAWGYEPRTSELAGSHDIGKREKIFPPSSVVAIDTTAAQETAAAAAAMAATAPAPQRPRNWRTGLFYALWLLALILPFIFGWMLLPACGMRLPFSDRIIYGWGDGAYCRQVTNPEAERGQREAQGLMAEMRRLEDALRDLLALCVPPTPPRPAMPPQPAPPVDQNRLEREGRTLNPEEDSVTLTWNNSVDLDLFLICPDGTRVGIAHSGCGAEASIDLNLTRVTTEPVEYVKWPRSALQPGRYRIEVENYNNRVAPAKTPFSVTLRRNGVPQTFTRETSREKEKLVITEFTVP